MRPSEVTIEVLNAQLDRVGQILPDYWTDVKAVSRLRDAGHWELSLPAELPITQALATPGSGILITGPQGELFSGPTETGTETASQDDPLGMIKFEGTDFVGVLADGLAYPDPGNPDEATQAVAYDLRSGPAETVIGALIADNVGDTAPDDRRVGFMRLLHVAIDQGRGRTVKSSTRFDPLLDTAAQLAKVGGVGFRVTVDATGLLLSFFEPADLSRLVRFDIANGTLTSYEGSVAKPTITRAIVAGQGEGAARSFRARTSPDAEAAEALWGRRIERFKDERNTNDPDELAQAGDELLADGGATQVTMKLTPSDDQTMRLQVDYDLGDFVTAVSSRGELAQVVTTVGISATSSGIRIAADVGDLDPEDVAVLQYRRRIGRLETRG